MNESFQRLFKDAMDRADASMRREQTMKTYLVGAGGVLGGLVIGFGLAQLFQNKPTVTPAESEIVT